MTDWLDELQAKKESEEDEKALKEKIKKMAYEEKTRQTPNYIGYKNNKYLVDDIYQRIIDYVNRANEIGKFNLRTKSTDSYSLHIKTSDIEHKPAGKKAPDRPRRCVSLYIDFDSFQISFYWYASNLKHTARLKQNSSDSSPIAYSTKRNIDIAEVDENYISFLVKWVATGEPELEDQLTKSDSVVKKYFNKLFS